MGGLLGAFGGGFARAVTLPLRAVTPWFLVAALVASALDLGRRIAPAPGLANILRRLMRYGAKFSPTARGALMGGMTPLLPCGLLYGIYATAFTAGSFGRGLLLMLAFAAGGVPSLLLAQYSMGLSARLGPRGALVLKRVVPLVAAAVLAWRALATSAGHSCH